MYTFFLVLLIILRKGLSVKREETIIIGRQNKDAFLHKLCINKDVYYYYERLQ